jgi:hypothetical protein
MGGTLLAVDGLEWGSFLFGSMCLPADPVLVGDRWRAIWLKAALAMVWIAQAGRLTPAAPHAMVLRTIREAAMRAPRHCLMRFLSTKSIWRRSNAS